MNAMQQALVVYQQAVTNMQAGKATTQDELLVALWDQVQEQEAVIQAQSYKLAVLETKEVSEFDKQTQYDDAMAVVNKIRYTH